MGYARTTPTVLAALTKFRGLDVQIGDLVAETGYDRGQIQSAINSLIKRDGLPITVIVRGAAWRYESSNAAAAAVPPSPKVAKNPGDRDREFTWVGMSAKGEHIVRGNASNFLYVLDQVEI